MTTLAAPSAVVGAGGLLGSAVRAALAAHGEVAAPSVPWTDQPAAVDALVDVIRGLASAGGPWRLAWCAGAGVTASAHEAIDREVATIAAVVDRLAHGDLSGGTIFLASSAGGVYAGSRGAPFTEASPVAPLSRYGEGKLATEAEMGRLARATGARLVVGRLSNLYGPGQDLAKAQGLVSQLCRAQLTGQPVGIYVPLDTVRDYLYVRDAAALVVASLGRAAAELPAGGVATKILASQRSASIAAVLGEVRRVSRRRPVVRLSVSAQALVQARDLRFRSVVWPDLDARAVTPLAVGVGATMLDMARRINGGRG